KCSCECWWPLTSPGASRRRGSSTTVSAASGLSVPAGSIAAMRSPATSTSSGRPSKARSSPSSAVAPRKRVRPVVIGRWPTQEACHWKHEFFLCPLCLLCVLCVERGAATASRVATRGVLARPIFDTEHTEQAQSGTENSIGLAKRNLSARTVHVVDDALPGMPTNGARASNAVRDGAAVEGGPMKRARIGMPTPSATRLGITAAGHRFVAETHAGAPRTVAAFMALLPYRQKLIHVRWSGEAVWVPLGDFDL